MQPYLYILLALKISQCLTNFSNKMYIYLLFFRVISIHEKLSNLAQIAEISLPSIPEIASCEDIRDREEVGVTVDTDMEVSY